MLKRFHSLNFIERALKGFLIDKAAVGLLGIKAGFTLAEVLITLGIIGVVAAMSIPTLITSVQKIRTATELKKSFAEISVAVRLAEDEFGDVSGWTYDNKTSDAIACAALFDTYLMPFMKVSRKELLKSDLVYYTPSGTREASLAVLRGNSVAYTLLSGAQMIASNNSIGTNKGSMGSIQIIIDLNGYNSKPNKFGRDAFFLFVIPTKGVRFHSINDGESFDKIKTRQELLNGPSSNSYQCNKRGRGMWCGALIQKDGWKISPDYPWK